MTENGAVILERMTARQVRTLALIVKAAGHATRSNYNAGSLHMGEWPLFWKTLDWLVLEGLVLRVGRFYHPTTLGEKLATEARHRRWA
jgi:hypothetical protein